MKAMILNRKCDLSTEKNPLTMTTVLDPIPDENEILIKIAACGVCHTELDEIEGRTPPPVFPIILGHQVVGKITEKGENVRGFDIGERVGVGWIYSACGKCSFCVDGKENLCSLFKATGRDENGGYAEFMKVHHSFAFQIPEVFSDAEAAPLLCAGAIGYRSLRLSKLEDGQKLGLTGFGASAHLVLKMVNFRYPDVDVYVFARSEKERRFARELGAVWAGDTSTPPPQKLNSIIDTTPAWKPVLEALRYLESGGRLIINAIRKEDRDKSYLMEMDYPAHLWLEKEIKTVANVARKDISEFLTLAAEIPIRPVVETFPLEDANKALLELKEKKIRGAKVLKVAAS